MLICNNKPICLIGYKQSTILQEANHFFSNEFAGDIVIIDPESFFDLSDKDQYQYGVAFTLDLPLRQKIINYIDENNFDCIKYIHSTCVIYGDPDKILGRGTCVFPFSSILLNSKVGNHCVIETYCLVSHYVEIGNNVLMHSGTMIAGRTKIGNNCLFNFKSSALNTLTICDNVQVNALSSITKNITDPGVYVGTPARKFQKNDQ
jgi:UDP-3-O-[3-hydroxymyristoyl] glucosamine N-acyltransferase